MAEMASTPFHGRRHVPMDDFDENTCAVEIVMKKKEEQHQDVPQQQLNEGPVKPNFSAEQFEPARNNEVDNVALSPIMETSRYFKL